MSDSQQQEEVSRIAKKLQEAKIQDAKLQEEKETTQQSGSESSGASSPIKRKKIADAIASDASIDENVRVTLLLFIHVNLQKKYDYKTEILNVVVRRRDSIYCARNVTKSGR